MESTADSGLSIASDDFTGGELSERDACVTMALSNMNIPPHML